MINIEEELKNFKGKHYIPNDEFDYKKLYEQQKQRADELEKRWSELGEIISSKYNVIDDASFKTILLFVILLMKDLEENNNA